jgi:signal transduction histidine kinase/ligand-binding sensor domain-containing protein
MRRVAPVGRQPSAWSILLVAVLAVLLFARSVGTVPPGTQPDPTAGAAPAGPAPAQSASYAIRAWTVENGLPQGSISDLAETPDGYLWIATNGGLVRFDGLRFALIDATRLPWRASNEVQALAQARQGGLWVATAGASMIRTDGRRELEVLPDRQSTEPVRRLAVAPDGTLWSASYTVVERYAQGRWHQVALPERGSHDVRTLFIDHAGIVWVGTAGGLFSVDGDRCERADIVGLGPDADVVAIFEDHDRRLWVGGSRGLAAVQDDPAGRRAVWVPGIESRVTAITQTPDGAIWAAAGDGVYLLGPVPRISIPTPRRLASSEVLGGSVISRLMVTRAGTVVAGTIDAGFRVFTRRPFDLLRFAEGLPGIRVHHLADDGAGGVWLGGGCDGLTHVATTLLLRVHRPPELGLVSPCVRGLLRDRHGGLWVGQASGGLTRIRPDGSTRTWDPSHGLPRSAIGPLLEDRQGRVWVGGTGGIVCRVELDDRVTCPAAPLSGAPQVVWSLAEDGEGNVWVGQIGRLTRVSGRDSNDTRTWTTAEGIPPAPIRTLVAAPDRTLWLGTYGAGLARIRDGRIASITTRQGLFDNAISVFVDDPTGRVWLLGNRGVLTTRRTDLDAVADGSEATVHGAVVGPADGMPEGNGGHPAGLRLQDGRVALATVQGLAVFDPARVPDARPPQVVVEDVVGVEQSQPERDLFLVPPGGGPVEIHFSAPSVGNAGSVRLRYRLSGRDPAWLEAGADRRAIYSDLAPGTFTFQVSSSQGTSAWSQPVTALTLRVVPLWWQTWWARGLALVLGLTAVAGFVQLRLRTVERRNAALAREIRERQRAEEEAHRHLLALSHVGRLATAGELTASLAHELGQPLMAIVASAEAAKMILESRESAGTEVRGILAEIGQQGRRASDVLRGLRRFLGRGSLELGDVDLSTVVREVMRLLDSTLTSALVQPVLDLADDAPAVRGDRVPLEQVVVNLVLNAVEAMRDRPAGERRLVVRTGYTSRRVRVTVLDTGPGLPEGRAEPLFEPFRTTKPGGMGMGLAICRSIVEAHGGRIRGRNGCGGGAVFSFALPVGSQDTPPVSPDTQASPESRSWPRAADRGPQADAPAAP